MHDNHPHSELTSAILGSCFDVMNELGTGFLESVYKNALVIAIKEKGLKIEVGKDSKLFLEIKRLAYILQI